MNSIRSLFARHGLYRSSEGRILGGVCAGLGRRLGLEPWPARLLFVLVLIVVPGFPILIYPVLWIVLPKARPGDLRATSSDFVPPNAEQ